MSVFPHPLPLSSKTRISLYHQGTCKTPVTTRVWAGFGGSQYSAFPQGWVHCLLRGLAGEMVAPLQASRHSKLSGKPFGPLVSHILWLPQTLFLVSITTPPNPPGVKENLLESRSWAKRHLLKDQNTTFATKA